MPSSRAFGLSSSSASSRHANRARAASDEEAYSDDSSYRKVKKSSSSSKSAPKPKRAADEDEAAYAHVRPAKKSAPSTAQRQSSTRRNEDAHDAVSDEEPERGSAGVLSDELLMERRAYDAWVEKKLSKLEAKRDQTLEDRVEQLRSERDDVQAQYDELRKLRNTDAEQALDEFRKVAEARYRHDKDLINSLKVKVEAAEKRAREAEGGAAAGSDRSMSMLNATLRESVQPETPDHRLEELEKQHRKEMAEATRLQKRLEEDVRTYKLQLEQEIAQSKALLAAATTAPTSSSTSAAKMAAEPSAASASLAAMEDEKAVRKLYEDLTGLVVTGVERIDAAQPFRRFKAIFAQEDYYSVLMDLEESSSKVTPSAGGKAHMRDDIVYVPKIDDDRDSELLNSTMVPQEWLEALRFDRNMLFKWYEKTRKALLTDEARLKIRAREERSRH